MTPFASKEGVSSDVLADTNDDDSTGTPETSEANDSTSKGKLPPVTQLAHAMESGMTAIATARSIQSSTDVQLRSLASAFEQQTRAIEVQQQETRRFQELQRQLLQQLVGKQK